MKRITALFLLFAAVLTLTFTACAGEGGDLSSAESGITSDTSLETESVTQSESSKEQSDKETSGGEAVSVFANTKYYGRDSVKYVALGDSIARGYGLKDPVGRSYPALIANAFRKSLPDTEVDFTNYAVDGMTTQGLIELLATNADKVDGADIITVCIGANNLLGTFLSIVEEYYPDIVPARGEGDSPSEDKSGDISGETVDSAALIDAIRAIEARVESEEFSAAMQAGIEKLNKDLPQILHTLKSRAPDAEIYITTVYSPYHGINLSMPYIDVSLDMSALSDKWVSALNTEIRRIVAEQGCILVDPYGHFEEKGGLVNAGGTLMPFNYSFDPHPNLGGHAALANLHIKAITGK